MRPHSPPAPPPPLQVGDPSAGALATGFPGMRHLDLGRTGAAEAVVRALAERLPGRLQAVSLGPSSGVSEEAVAEVRRVHGERCVLVFDGADKLLATRACRAAREGEVIHRKAAAETTG